MRYNPAADTVTVMSATLPTGRSGTSAAWDGDGFNAYVFGGDDGSSSSLNQIVRYNPSLVPPASASQTVPNSISTPSVTVPQVCVPTLICVGPFTIPRQTIPTPLSNISVSVNSTGFDGFVDPHAGDVGAIGPITVEIPTPFGPIPVTLCPQTCPGPVPPESSLSGSVTVTLIIGPDTFSVTVPIDV